MPNKEQRYHAANLGLSEEQGEPTLFVGRVCAYESLSELIDGAFCEILTRGCFDEHLKTQPDVYASINHDAQKILGRVSSGTLILDSRDDGIYASVSIGAYSYAKDLVEAIRRGDIRGMSFIFQVDRDSWERQNDIMIRRVHKAKLYEISYVHYPCYKATEAALRAAEVGLKTALNLNEICRKKIKVLEAESFN
jgi:HK97 family phage prohead protease